MASGDAKRLAPMPERDVRPTWVRRINSIVGATGADLRDLVAIDPDELLEAAVGGMRDGDLGDPRWEDAFPRLAPYINHFGVELE